MGMPTSVEIRSSPRPTHDSRRYRRPKRQNALIFPGADGEHLGEHNLRHRV
jgi:hypothetical protein